MWADIRRLYADALAFALALPILFSIPVIVEFAQHVVEIDIGMYRYGGMAAIALDDRRLAFGFAKTLALLLPGYWFVRYIAWDRDASKAKAIERPAAMLFAALFALQGAVQWFALFGPSLGELLRLGERAGNYATLVAVIGSSVLGIYLSAWLIAWPLGNAAIGPLRSFAVMAGGFWKALGFLAAGVLPLMIVHYALGYGAIGRPEWLVWIMMAVDAVVTGFLALTMTGGSYLGAMAAARRKGVSLLPNRAPAD